MDGSTSSSLGLDSLADQPLIQKFEIWMRQYRSLLDRTTPHTAYRWFTTLGLIVIFMLRILLAQAFYIVTYALGIYLLNLFLAFLQPKFDPSLEMDIAEAEVEEGAPGLPTSNGPDDDEFRPFIRRLPEFRFWYSATRAIVLSLFATLIPAFDVPVYWPILLIYFCVLLSITLRRQIAHMRKYKYVPWDLAKQRYGGKK